MERYSSYKDSGVPWIGEIPDDWRIEKAKYLINISNGSDPKTEGDTPVYGSGASSFRTCGESKEGPAVLVGRKGTLHIPHWITGRYWNVDTAFDVKVKTNSIILKYYYYLSTCFDYKFYISQTTLPSMRQADYENMLIPVPDRSEQEAIVAYLDKVSNSVEAAIEELDHAIARLDEYRQSLINEAVTKGLNPNVPMKDSGVPWIGEIPSDWRIEKAKYLVDIRNGVDPRTEGGTPVYGSGASSFRTCGETKEGPTVLLGRLGATLHIPHWIVGKYWNMNTAFDVQSKEITFILKYYYYLATCFDYRFYVSQNTLPIMGKTDYENMLIPVPPQSEQ